MKIFCMEQTLEAVAQSFRFLNRKVIKIIKILMGTKDKPQMKLVGERVYCTVWYRLVPFGTVWYRLAQ